MTIEELNAIANKTLCTDVMCVASANTLQVSENECENEDISKEDDVNQQEGGEDKNRH